MRIVYHSDGAIVAICDEGRSERLTLTKAETALYAVDLAALRSRVSSALQLRSVRDPLGTLPGVLHVGNWEPKPSLRIPVVLLVSREEHAFEASLLDTILAGCNPVIVLTPTRDLWREGSSAIAEERKAMLAPACELITARGEEWAASEAWDLSLGQFVQSAGIRISGGFSALKKRARIARAGGTAAKLKDALREWYRSAKPALLDRGELLPAPEVKLIARSAGVDPTTASRWLNGPYRDRDAELKVLWVSTADERYIRHFKG